jgi:hypothetical protein
MARRKWLGNDLVDMIAARVRGLNRWLNLVGRIDVDDFV